MAVDIAIGAPDQNELVIALVAAVGTDVGMVAEQLAIELSAYAYDSELLRLSTYLAEEFGKDFFKEEKFDEALWEAMSAGDTLRNDWGRGDALALHAISDIVVTRNQRTGSDDEACETCGAERLGPGLDVGSEEVVQAGDGCLSPDACVSSAMVVGEEPAVKGCGAFVA